jgi:hypothetical protein
MESNLSPAIQALERRLEELEHKANELRSAINVLCAESGLPPRYSESGSGVSDKSSTGKITQIRDDTFYGKKQQTAVREYLEMRATQDLGPAKPREIFEALKAGGYQFEAKDDDIALVSLRAMLRKRTNFFHKLPTGSYGLTSWYPDAKSPRSSSTDESDDESDD